MRYYYKSTDGRNWLNLKETITNYEDLVVEDYQEATEEEWENHQAELQAKLEALKNK